MQIDLTGTGALDDKLEKVFMPEKFGKLTLSDVCAKYKELGFVAMHNSDINTFKRCRRMWGFSSPFRMHLGKSDVVNQYLWFGSGFHFAFEDFFGLKIYDNPLEAFLKYYESHTPEQMPDNAKELRNMADEMFTYFKNRYDAKNIFLYDEFGKTDMLFNDLEVLQINGKPAVEVPFTLILEGLSKQANIPIVVHGTFDVIYKDKEGKLYLGDYKTAKKIDTSKLLTDPQITQYLWAAEHYFDCEFEGMIYMQFNKSTPHPPKKLKSGQFSTDKRQLTTPDLYISTLIQEFGEIPGGYEDILDHLYSVEEEKGDQFIRMDIVTRSNFAKEQWHRYLINIGTEMINPILPLYPNPTRDCSWDCNFRGTCFSMDNDGDYKYTLNNTFVVRNETAKQEINPWRQLLKYPSEEVTIEDVNKWNGKKERG